VLIDVLMVLGLSSIHRWSRTTSMISACGKQLALPISCGHVQPSESRRSFNPNLLCKFVDLTLRLRTRKPTQIRHCARMESTGSGHCTGESQRMASTNTHIIQELEDEAAFASIASLEGEISICGFGSLLSEKSALYTFPNLRNFRVAVLRDFRRVFAHVAPVFLDRGIANVKTKELSSLSVEPCEGESILVTVFEVSVNEVSAFIAREHEFRFLAVTPEGKDGHPFPQQAVVCARYSDEEYRRIRCQGSDEEYYRHYGRHNIEQIWRDDIYPCRVYLRHCVLAAKKLGLDEYNSFLDHTYLGDRTTTIRQYLESGLGVGVMEELPPIALQERYGG